MEYIRNFKWICFESHIDSNTFNSIKCLKHVYVTKCLLQEFLNKEKSFGSNDFRMIEQRFKTKTNKKTDKHETIQQLFSWIFSNKNQHHNLMQELIDDTVKNNWFNQFNNNKGTYKQNYYYLIVFVFFFLQVFCCFLFLKSVSACVILFVLFRVVLFVLFLLFCFCCSAFICLINLFVVLLLLFCFCCLLFHQSFCFDCSFFICYK